MPESVARTLIVGLPDWRMFPEVSFNIYGERGIIDLVLWHAGQRAMLIVELKTELVDVTELLGTMDRRRRLAPRIGRERGWEPDSVSAWIIVAGGRTTERRIAAHKTMLRAGYPLDGRAMRAWLRRPVGSVAGLSTWTLADTGKALAPTRRVRVKRTAATRVGPPEGNAG